MKGYLRKRGRVWYTTVDLPRVPGEKRKQRCFRLGAMTKAEAQEKERDLLRSFDEGKWSGGRQMTVGELLDMWLRDNESHFAAKTWEGYESKVRLHLKPAIGSIVVSRLRPKHVVDALNAIRRKGLSPQTNVHLHRILHTALNYGKRTLRVVEENVVSDVRCSGAHREIATLSEEQVRLIVAAARGTRLEVPVIVAALTGLRRSELLGLRWSAIDLDRGLLSVTTVLEQSRRYGVRLKNRTKSPSSRRTIPLAQAVIEVLRLHKERQDAEQIGRGQRHAGSGLVFCNSDASPWPPDSFTKEFAAIARRVGMKGKFRFHDSRHAFASIVLKNGTSVKEVAELLGHASPTVTLSAYAHQMEGAGRAAVDALAASILEGRRAEPSCEQT